MRALAMLPLAAMLCTTAASAGERCLAGQYRPPESIADDMRPYLLCGLFQRPGWHNWARLNGHAVILSGGDPEACVRTRLTAFEASERRLASVMPDAAARRSFVEAEFEEADQLLQVAARSDDLGIGEGTAAPQCRISDAQDR